MIIDSQLQLYSNLCQGKKQGRLEALFLPLNPP